MHHIAACLLMLKQMEHTVVVGLRSAGNKKRLIARYPDNKPN